jgi:hypothetical protein
MPRTQRASSHESSPTRCPELHLPRPSYTPPRCSRRASARTQTHPSHSSPSTPTPFYRKLRTNIANARHNPLTRHVSVLSASFFSPGTMAPSMPLPTTVTVPLVPLQVPVPLLLVYALDVRTNPSALAATPSPSPLQRNSHRQLRWHRLWQCVRMRMREL